MSEYVNPTGEGYQGTYAVRSDTVRVPIAMIDVDWQPTRPVFATRVPDGVALAQSRPEEMLGRPIVLDRAQDDVISVPAAACRALGVDRGDDVRVYLRDADGLLLVDADDDPRVEGSR